MPAIAVLGANGQVGVEICLCLSQMRDVRVIPVVRTRLGAAFLEKCGIECRVGSMRDAGEATRLLAGADLVADFARPFGLPWDIRREMRATILLAIRCAPAKVPYVFISSTMAFGMPGFAERYGRYLLARTPYAADKRFGERLTRLRGLIERRPTYVLRLGQVHGDLQMISREMLLSASGRPVALHQRGETPSDVVFCSTIALALHHLAQGKDPPGKYSLVESPEWSRRRIFEFYAEQKGVVWQLDERPPAPPGGQDASRRTVRGLVRGIFSGGFRSLVANRDFLTAQLMPLPPAIEQRLKAQHLTRRALAEVGSGEASTLDAPGYRDGSVPGRRLTSLADTFEVMAPVRAAVEKLLDERIGAESHNLHTAAERAETAT